jgi:hypothetical protein
MKKSILFILVFIIFKLAHTQSYYNWLEPVAITDSLSINSNPNVLKEMGDLGYNIYCFYEKKLSAGSPSQIWFRNIYTMTDEQLVFSDDIFEYRNPKMLVFSPFYNARYFLIYESNETGNFDIFGVEFFINGSFGSPFQLTNTPADENSCYISESDYPHTTCWETEESIKFAHISMAEDSLQFTEIYTIDTNNCFEPVCSEKFVFYRKIIYDSSHIYFSEYNDNTNLWTDPDTVYATGNNINLKMGRYMMFDFEGNICWENNGQALYWDSWSEEVTFLDFQGITECFEPAFLAYDIITENIPNPAVYTFCSGEGETKEVYATIDYYSEVQNISNNNFFNSNPKLFNGHTYSCGFDVINIWQTQINDNSVLYMSQIYISYGSVFEYQEKNNSENILKTTPNPFNYELNIKYYLLNNLEASIYIYSLTGKQIDHITLRNQKPGWNSYTWKLADNDRIKLQQGVYFIVLKQGNATIVQKVIYSK